ncbi:SOUL family heme-binding protein [Crateriforma conspicua]|uniref:SOUL heme-binding protein n=1 Tax=Crateriforma conspicua TaxID=2527996 RepID=A0A5C5Y212_9PLAN|nr:heme-binding protein [Crateriforma conspicua]TWT68681.1 SOUL heme-binding protein [Crateriforma conspicua]
MTRKMFHLGVLVGAAVLGTAAWTMTARAGYESAEYKVVETDGDIEIREYPDLMLAATSSKLDSQGRDGSFMRLFRYISGNNENDQKIAMTTPVFMEGDNGLSDVSMGFVMPKEVAVEGVPDPKSDGVQIRKRDGGRFAVIRFSGRMDSKLAKKQEARLRDWMNARGLEGETTSEAAGYDPPFTPGPLRRNEILIRLKQSSDASPSVDTSMRGDGL